MMDFYEVVDKVVDLLCRRGRVTYSSLKIQFQLDDAQLIVLREEILYAHESTVQADDRGFVWNSEAGLTVEPTPASSPSTPEPTAPPATDQEREPVSYTPTHLAEKILTSRSALEGERKQVTVLFCDLRNSTAIAEKIGAESMHGLLSRFFELAMDEIHRYEGTVNQLLGDGFMALFGAPIAHEDHARRAVLAALDLQRTIREHDEELGGQHGVELAFRMGLNTGMVVVGSIGNDLRLDYTAIGDTTNLAARLEQIAEPGTVLVSENTSRLVQGYVRLEALTPVEVKGKTEPIPIYKVLGTLPRRSPIVSRSERTLSQFVGRERELATLEELFAQVESANGQVVGIVGEAGQGKSRLLYEFRQRIKDKTITYLEGRCLSYGRSIPYHPIIDVLRHHCGISETDHAEAVMEKVGVALQEIGLDPEESAPYLLQLLGVKEGKELISMLTPETIRNQTFEMLREMSLKGSQPQPLVIEIEDNHWVDKTSEDCLTSLVESLAGASILLLTTYRPGYRPLWIEKSYATQVSLHGLAQQDALNIIHSSQPTALSSQVAQTIVEKAEGNPFFLEELTRAVAETGEQRTDVVPDTVQGVLSARIDRLPEIHKRLLQTASVLGRAFSLRLLEKIWDGSDSPVQLLEDLKRQEFLFERTGVEESAYVFRHALTENVAYESLLTTRRQALHAAAGQALETLYADRLEDAYDRLAYHYARTDNAAKAVEYLTLVAEKAAQRYAHVEAVATLQEAIVHAKKLQGEARDQSILDLVIRQADSLFLLGRRQDIIALLLGQQDCLQHTQLPLLVAQYYIKLGEAYSFLGNRNDAWRCMQDALHYAKQSGDATILGYIYAWMAQESNFRGQYRQGVSYGEQAVLLLEGVEDRQHLGFAYLTLGYVYSQYGNFTKALEVADKLRAFSDILDNRRFQSKSIYLTGLAYDLMGEWERAADTYHQAINTSPTPFDAAIVLGTLGYLHVKKGNVVEAISTLENALQQANQYRSLQIQSRFKTYLGEAYYANGQIEKADDLVRQGLALAEEVENPFGIVQAKRALGHIAQSSGDLAMSDTYLREALAIYTTVQSRNGLAHTHLDLAALAHTQGNLDTVTTHLSTAYAWFKKLQVPKWMERTEQLAQEYGVTLTEVELEEFETEGSS